MEDEIEAHVASTAAWLAGDEAREHLAADPYWPKWDGPWWRMTLLAEMGLADRIPRAAAEAMVESIRRTWIRTFPLRVEDLPPGADPHRNVPCHCAIGTIHVVLSGAGIDVDAELPWLTGWLPRYQLPDGGLNCDEAAYTRPMPRSSIVSTLPALEAILRRPSRTPGDTRFLEAGVRYLVERRLCRSTSRGGRVMDDRFLEPAFPRFYEYDVLRGLRFVVEASASLERPIPIEAIAEVRASLEARSRAEGGIVPRRRAFDGAGSLRRDAAGAWGRGPAATFPLLEAVSRPGVPSPWLDREWERIRRALP